MDYQLGQQIATLIAAQRTSDRPAAAILAPVQDLLGADTSLLGPLRDLLLRPAYRQLTDQGGGSRSQLLAGRDALLQDLALTYHPAVVARLAAVIDGSLALPPAPPPPAAPPAAAAAVSGLPQPPASPLASPSWQEPGAAPGWNPQPPSAAASAWSAAPASPPSPPAAAPPLQAPSAAPSGGVSSVTALLIALVSLLAGAVVLALGWMMLSSRPLSGSAPLPPAAPVPPSSPASAPAPSPPTPKGAAPEAAPPAPGAWGPSSDYKFGQLPGGNYPNSCAFSRTDADGRITTDKTQLEYWACRDVGGNPERGYRVVWADGKETTYTFAPAGNGTVVGTNGNSFAMRWRNDSHQGDPIIVIDHQDGATTWIPGHIE